MNIDEVNHVAALGRDFLVKVWALDNPERRKLMLLLDRQRIENESCGDATSISFAYLSDIVQAHIDDENKE